MDVEYVTMEVDEVWETSLIVGRREAELDGELVCAGTSARLGR